MKNKFIFLATFVAMIALASCGGEQKTTEDTTTVKIDSVKVVTFAGTYNIAVGQASVKWFGYKVVGDGHDGAITSSTGNLTVVDSKITAGTVTVPVDSITIGNIPADDKNYKKLLEHLKSPDFLDTKKFPTAVFTLTGVSEKEGKTMIAGNLQIKDVTKPIEFPATVTVTETEVSVVSEKIKINRVDFGIKYNEETMTKIVKEKLIKNEMELQIELKATK